MTIIVQDHRSGLSAIAAKLAIAAKNSWDVLKGGGGGMYGVHGIVRIVRRKGP